MRLFKFFTCIFADSEQAPKKIRKERPKRRGQAQQNRQEENIDYETVEERSETPLQEDSSSLLQEPLRNQHLPMVFSCGTLIQTGHTYSIKGFNSVTVAATEIVSTPNSTCKLKGDLILNGHIDHVVKIEMPVERAQSASCPLGKKDREFLGVLSLFNRQNQEELRNSDVSVRRRVREAQLGAALHREVQCALKCRNFKRRFSLGLCSFEHDLDILNLDAVSKTREISYRNENFEGFDSLLGNHWDVLPVEEQQHFRFVTRLTLKAKGMQIVGSVYTAVCRCSFGPDYRALVKSRELTVDAGEVSDLDEEDTGNVTVDTCL